MEGLVRLTGAGVPAFSITVDDGSVLHPVQAQLPGAPRLPAERNKRILFSVTERSEAGAYRGEEFAFDGNRGKE